MLRSLAVAALLVALPVSLAAPAASASSGKDIPPLPQPATPPPGPPAAAADAPFGVSGVEVVAERDRPLACFGFNRPLSVEGTGRSGGRSLDGFVKVEPATAVTLSVRDRDLCLEGLAHDTAYQVTLGAGLPAANGVDRLAGDVVTSVSVPSRRPSLGFRGQGYILPRVGAEGLPLRSVNVDRARLQILRVADRQLVERIYFGRLNQTLTDFDVGLLLEEQGEVVWRGEMAVGGERNRTTVTPFPIEAVLGELKPGVYIAVAEDAALSTVAWDQRATQWFIVSDMGLTSVAAENGLLVFARSLSGAQPLAGVELRLLGRPPQGGAPADAQAPAEAERGRAVTDAEGLARFPAGALDGGAQALFAVAPDGSFSLLDFETPALALNRRGSQGRAAPGALDVWMSTGRALHQPGDAIQLTALLRDPQARAVSGRPLVVELRRPDDVPLVRQRLRDGGLGGYAVTLALPETAPAGAWTVVALDGDNGPELGRLTVPVGAAAPTRLDLTVAADRPRIAADGKAVLSLDADPLQGREVGRLPGEVALILRPARAGQAGADGFRFGLVQEAAEPLRRPLASFTTNARGEARIPVSLGELPATTQPLEAELRVVLHDAGGRPVERTIVLPVDHQPFALGLRPTFTGDAVPEGASVGFDVVTLAPDGQRIAREGLSWELFEETLDYEWFEADGRWDWRPRVQDRRLTGGNLDTPAGGTALIEEQVPAGRYRLEVFDPETGIASSVRFSAGWWVSARQGQTPDTVEVVVQDPLHAPGGTARVFVKPPYDATVLLTLADRQLRHSQVLHIPAAGAFVAVPLDAELVAGAWLMATAHAADDPVRKGLPRRAVGTAWVSMDPAPRQLSVALPVPDTAAPRDILTVPVQVQGLAAGEAAHVVVRALTVAQPGAAGPAPDPAGWFFGRRRLDVTLRDVHGPLLQRDGTAPATPAAKGDSALWPEQPVLFSGVLKAGVDGAVEVPVTLPDRTGRLTLEAVAWSTDKVGSGQASLSLREPVLADLGLPARLAPGDTVQMPVVLENVVGPRGAYRVEFALEGPLTLDGGPVNFKPIPRGRRVSVNRTLTAAAAGEGAVLMTVTGDGGFSLTRRFPVRIRGAGPLSTRHQAVDLAPGGSHAVAVETDGILAVSPWPALDLPGQLLALADAPGPMGGVEPMASRLLALTAAEPWTGALGLFPDGAAKAEMRDLVTRLVAVQRADGGFALWGPEGEAEPWLTAFVLDVLHRARDAGIPVPETAWRRGLDWLSRNINNSWVDPADLPARAYALLVAARAKAIDAGPVRFFEQTYLDRLQTGLARIQLAAAFHVLGEGEAAQGLLARGQPDGRTAEGLRDFGTERRDAAAALALLAGMNAAPEELARRAAALAGLGSDPAFTGAQERAWLLLAGRALADRAGPMPLSLDGTPQTVPGLLLRRLPAGGPGLTVANAGERSLTLSVGHVAPTATEGAAPAAAGLSLERRVLTGTGQPADLSKVKAGELLVVVLEGKADGPLAGPLRVEDRVPAGFSIETVRPAGSDRAGGLAWLDTVSDPGWQEVQDNRYAAELPAAQGAKGFRLAYLMRAGQPGRFTLPPAIAQDTVQGDRQARADGGVVTVLP